MINGMKLEKDGAGGSNEFTVMRCGIEPTGG
jgi:hypothetical protein